MHGVCLDFDMGLHLAREHLTGHHWLMDEGSQQLSGGRPRTMTAYSADHTVTSSYSWSHTSLVKEDNLGQKGYPCWVVKPIGYKKLMGHNKI